MTALGRRVGGPGAALSRGRTGYPQVLGAHGQRTLPCAQLDARGTVARRQTFLRCPMSIGLTLSLLATRDALLVIGPKDTATQDHRLPRLPISVPVTLQSRGSRVWVQEDISARQDDVVL